MTWGAVNEWTAQAAYARLGQLADHPTLSTLLARIMRQEGRHADFYARQAERRLCDDAKARWLTRTALRRWWAPVGSTLLPPREVSFLASHLFTGDEGRAMTRRIDRRLDQLPGLSGLDLQIAQERLCLRDILLPFALILAQAPRCFVYPCQVGSRKIEVERACKVPAHHIIAVERKIFIVGFRRNALGHPYRTRTVRPKLPLGIGPEAERGGHGVKVKILDQFVPGRLRFQQSLERLNISGIAGIIITQAAMVHNQLIAFHQRAVVFRPGI